MKFFTIKCDCGCPDPLIARDPRGQDVVLLFKSKELAEIQASHIINSKGGHPLVKEFEIKEILV